MIRGTLALTCSILGMPSRFIGAKDRNGIMCCFLRNDLSIGMLNSIGGGSIPQSLGQRTDCSL